jgi:natural resistance-associated macrophage protein 2
MCSPTQRSTQPQFMTSVEGNNRSNGPETPLIDSIDVDQIVIPEVWMVPILYSFVGLEKNKMSSQLPSRL